MKIRQGFVSNSSSSSFVIVGFKTNDNMMEDDNIGKFEQLYVESDYDYITGYVIADGDFYDIEEREVGDLDEKITEMAEHFGKNKSDIKLYCGVRPS